MDIYYLIEQGGLHHFQLQVVGSKPHSFEFELRSISSWECDEANTPIVDDAELFAAGFIKWDGCSNIIFDGGGYAHFCGVKDIQRHGLAMLEVYRLAHEYFLSSDDSSYAQQNPDCFLLGGDDAPTP